MTTSTSAVAVADVRLFYPILIKGQEAIINNGLRCPLDPDVTTCDKLCLRLQQQKEYRGKRINLLDAHLNTLSGNTAIAVASYVEVMLDHQLDGQAVIASGRQTVIRPVSPTKPRGLVRPSSPEQSSRVKSPDHLISAPPSSSASSSSVIYTQIPNLPRPPASPRTNLPSNTGSSITQTNSQTSHYASIPPLVSSSSPSSSSWVRADTNVAAGAKSPRGAGPIATTSSPRTAGSRSPVTDRQQSASTSPRSISPSAQETHSESTSPHISPRPNNNNLGGGGTGWKFPQPSQQHMKSAASSSVSLSSPLSATTTIPTPLISPPAMANVVSSLPPPPTPLITKGGIVQKKRSIVIPLSDLGVLAGQEEEEFRRRETNAFSEMKKLQEEFESIVIKVRTSLTDEEKRTDSFLDALIKDLLENKPMQISPPENRRKLEQLLSADPKTLSKSELMIRNAEELRRKRDQTETKWKFAEKRRKQNEFLKRAILEEEKRKKKLSSEEESELERQRKRAETARTNNVEFLEFCSREGLVGATTWNPSAEMDSSLCVRFELESERERRREEGNVPRLTLAEGGVFVCLRYFPLFPRAVFPSRKRRPRNSAYHTAHRVRIANFAQKHLFAESKKRELETQIKLEKAKKRADELALSGNPRMSLLLLSSNTQSASSSLLTSSRQFLLSADDFEQIDSMLRSEVEKHRTEFQKVKRKLKAARAEGDLLTPKVKIQREADESEVDFLARKLIQKRSEREEIEILVRITQSSQPLLLAMDSVSGRGSHSSVAAIWDEVDTILRNSVEVRKAEEGEELDPHQQLDRLIELSKKIKTPHLQNSASVTSVSTSVTATSSSSLVSSALLSSSVLPLPRLSGSPCNAADLLLDLQQGFSDSHGGKQQQQLLPSPRKQLPKGSTSSSSSTSASSFSSSSSSSVQQQNSSPSSPTSPRKGNESPSYLKANNYVTVFAATTNPQKIAGANLVLPPPSSSSSSSSSYASIASLSPPSSPLSKSANAISTSSSLSSGSTLSRSTTALAASAEHESKAEQAAAKAAASLSFRRLETSALPTTSSPRQEDGSGLSRMARAPPLTSPSPSSSNANNPTLPPSTWMGSPKQLEPLPSPRSKQHPPQQHGFVGDHRSKKERLADLLMRMSVFGTPPQISFETAQAVRSGQSSPRPGPSLSSLTAHQEAIQLLDDLITTDSNFSWAREKEDLHQSGVSMSALDELDRLLLAAKTK